VVHAVQEFALAAENFGGAIDKTADAKPFLL
jgi:hypothetical protein